jgi:hypothetical protein
MAAVRRLLPAVVFVVVGLSSYLPAGRADSTLPVTASAGRPISCAGRPTVVDDPVGDILTYAPGSAPAPVSRLTTQLSRIDITRASVQIDGRTLCATFAFARPPASADFQLHLNLRDTSTASCCASLWFRSTRGRLELGYFFLDITTGAERLRPVANAGAILSGNILMISGTLPAPAAWQSRTHRMPSAQDLGWSVTTTYAPAKYGPYYGDWLPRPRPQAVAQPMIRQYDGATVLPPAAR